jgi:WD40 repeat protein/serine/threonine protein kinase
MNSKKSKQPESSEAESWLRNAARAPKESIRAAEQLSPLMPTKHLPETPSSLGVADTPFLEDPSQTTSTSIEEPKERYQIEREFARGGLGRVMLAKDKKLERVVAIKELLNPNEKMKERFFQEVKLTARLEHPSIVPIHDLGVLPNGEPFYAMKLVDGRSFDKVIAEQKTLEGRLALFPHLIDACKAIAYAHSKNVIHRDLKPHNILVGSFGETVVIDWGLAKELTSPSPLLQKERGSAEGEAYRDNADDGLTKEGSILGTPAYMPLEQAQGKTVDARADVYALGAILYHVLAGVHPYAQGKGKDTLLRVIAGPPTPLYELAPETPKELLSIVQKAMARDVNDRYTSAQQMLEELLQFQQGKLVTAHSYTNKELVARWVKRYRMALSVGSAAYVLIMAAFVASYYQIRKAERSERSAKQTAQHNETIAKQAEQNALDAKNAETKAKEESELSLVSLLEEQGKRALEDRDPAKAVVYLKEVYLKTPPEKVSTSLRFHLREALERLPRLTKDNVLDGGTTKFLEAGFSSDGKKIFLIRNDGTFEVLDAFTYQSLSTFGEASSTPENPLSIAWALAPKAARGAIKNNDKISILDLEKMKTTITIDQADAKEMYLSKDGSVLFTSSGEEGPWRAWDANTGAKLYEVPPTFLLWEFSEDGTKTIFVDMREQGGSYVLDTRSGKQLFTSHEGLALSNDGRALAVFKYDSGAHQEFLELWDTDSKTITGVIRQKYMYDRIIDYPDVLFAPDGVRVAVFDNRDHSFQIWDTSGKLLIPQVLNQDSNEIAFQAFSSDSTRLFTLSIDWVFSVWDANSGALLQRTSISPASEISGSIRKFRAQLSPDGSQFFLLHDGHLRVWGNKSSAGFSLGGDNGFLDLDGTKVATINGERVSVWDAQTRQLLLTFTEPQSTPTNVSFAPNGAYLATKNKDQSIKLWDATTGALLLTFPGNPNAQWAMRFSPDGKRMVSIGKDGRFELRDLKGELIASLEGHQKAFAPYCVFSPDSLYLATFSIGDGDPLRIWDASSGALLHSIEDIKSVRWASFSPDSQRLGITGYAESKTSTNTEIWDVHTGSRLLLLKGQAGGGLRTMFSSDGARIISASADKTAQVWDTTTGELLFSLEGHNSDVERASFSSDNRLIVTQSDDGTAKLWDAKTGELITTFTHYFPEGKHAKIYSAQFSSDGAWLITQGEDKVIRFWSTKLETRSPKEVAEYAEARVSWVLESGKVVKPPTKQR